MVIDDQIIPYLEVTEPGERCDWVGPKHVYYQLGMVEVGRAT